MANLSERSDTSWGATGLLVAVVGDFPAVAAEILDPDHEFTSADPDDRITFRLRALPPTDPRAAAWIGARVPLGTGGPETYVWAKVAHPAGCGRTCQGRTLECGSVACVRPLTAGSRVPRRGALWGGRGSLEPPPKPAP